MLFVMTSGISIQLKPFRIDITYPYFGLGIVLTAIGLTLCIGSAYYYGISNNQYKDSKTRSHTDGFQRNNAKCLDEKGISRFVPHSSI